MHPINKQPTNIIIPSVTDSTRQPTNEIAFFESFLSFHFILYENENFISKSKTENLEHGKGDNNFA